jgi:hypothetical protein
MEKNSHQGYIDCAVLIDEDSDAEDLDQTVRETSTPTRAVIRWELKQGHVPRTTVPLTVS